MTSDGRPRAVAWPVLRGSLFLLLGLVVSGVFSPVRFESEHIAVTAGGPIVEIDGRYEYRNASPLPTVLRLLIPFPIDDTLAPPESVALDIVDAHGRQLGRIDPVIHDDRYSLRLFFAPFETRHLRLRYAQRCTQKRGRYLLTTTSDWGRAIASAEFTLRLRPGFSLDQSNYPLELEAENRHGIRFGFSRQSFLPHQDWIFSWRTTQESTT